MKEDAKALFRCLAELDPAQEETLSVLIMDGILGASRGELVKLNKQAKKIAKISPVFSKVLEMAKAHRDWKSQKNKQGLRKARAKYLSLLRLNGLPVSLKVDLISRVRREALPLHSGNAVFEEVTKIIAAYGATERNFALSTLNQSVESLAGLDFPGMEKVVGGLAEEASQVLLSDHAIAGRRDQSLPEVAASIVKLALQGKDAKLAVGVLKQDYNFYRGNLEVMLSLAEAGEFEVLRKLVASKTGIYSLKGLGKYDQDFHKLVTKMLSELPEENRYHLEVVLANREDDLTKGGKPHQVLRAERLERLAAVFAERSKALKGDAYLEVLAIFAAYEGSALQLEKELLAVFEKMSLADGFDFERNSSSLRSSRGFQILKRVIERKIAAKDFKEVRDKVSDFQVHLENNNGNNVWRLRYQMDAVFGIVGASLIKLAVQSPDEVETVLAETKSYFNIAMQVSHRTGPLNTFDGVGLIVSALAGKGEGWKSFLASHPDHERHQKEVGSRGRDDLFQHLGSDEWLLPAMAETRKKALRALFDNPLYKERDFDYVHDFYGLLDAEFVHVDEVIEVITGLPKDHPVKLQGMFHVASLKTYRVKGKSAAKGIAAYTEALELAQEAGDEKLANQILAHRCDVMFRNKRKKEAKADAVKVNFELLPETDQKWVKKSRTEWLK